MKTVRSSILAASLVWTVLNTMGCSAFKTRDQKPNAVAQVRSAAFVGYTAEFPASREIGFDLASGKLGGSAGGSMLNQQLAEADQLYSKIHQSFQAQLNWKLMDSEKMRRDSAYLKSYGQIMEGWHNRFPPSSGINRYLVTGVMDYDSLRILEDSGRRKLMDDLKVDALIGAKVSVLLSGTTVMGIGSRKPQTHILFFVYGKGDAEPIWFESLEGEAMQASVGATGFIDEKLLAKLALQSADGALAKLGTTSAEN